MLKKIILTLIMILSSLCLLFIHSSEGNLFRIVLLGDKHIDGVALAVGILQVTAPQIRSLVKTLGRHLADFSIVMKGYHRPPSFLTSGAPHGVRHQSGQQHNKRESHSFHVISLRYGRLSWVVSKIQPRATFLFYRSKKRYCKKKRSKMICFTTISCIGESEVLSH